MPVEMAPHRAYYESCLGSWRCPLELQVEDAAALRKSGMAAMDRLNLRLLARWPRWLGRMWLETSVRKVSDIAFVHTTVVKWLGLPLMSSIEELDLMPDGQSFELRGVQRVAPVMWRPVAVSGQGRVNGRADAASYTLQWLGVELCQDTTREGDRVTLRQRGAGFYGVQALQRVSGA